MSRLFVIVVAAGLLIGFMLPGSDPAPVAAASADRPTERKVVLTRGSTGHFFTHAEVNGKPGVRFIVDTGASIVALSVSDATKIGIKVDPARFDIIGEGAGGPVRGHSIMIDSIDIDGIRAERVRGVVLEGSNLSLLGQSYLASVDEVNISGEYLSLRDAG